MDDSSVAYWFDSELVSDYLWCGKEDNKPVNCGFGNKGGAVTRRLDLTIEILFGIGAFKSGCQVNNLEILHLVECDVRSEF